MKQMKKTEMNKLQKAIHGFFCAFRGIAFCVRHERHMRIHLVATAYVLYFASFYDFGASEYAVLVLTCLLIMVLELINTSIEVVIDKVSPKYNVFAMIGKDIAAGAVFLGAIGSVAVGVIMFWDVDVFIKIGQYFMSDILKLAILLATVILSVIFVLRTKKRRTGAQRSIAKKQDIKIEKKGKDND